MQAKQRTLKTRYTFSGKGLHTGKVSTMVLCPAPIDHGVKFVRTDIGPDAVVEAVAEHVSDTSRSTTLSCGDASVHTVEHILSALTGLGIDNVRIEIDNEEVPILDGSAKPYLDALAADGAVEQDAPRRYVRLDAPVEIQDEKTGSFVRLEPAETFSFDVKVDFNSRVLGVQEARYDADTDYAREIGVCRTFVFFHEIEFLFQHGLVKGGDVDNAIVIVEHPVAPEQLGRMAALFGMPMLDVTPEGYLSNLVLRFPNECARHKLLDLIGDLRLCGGFLQAKVTAFKPGHSLNTAAAKAVRTALSK